MAQQDPSSSRVRTAYPTPEVTPGVYELEEGYFYYGDKRWNITRFEILSPLPWMASHTRMILDFDTTIVHTIQRRRGTEGKSDPKMNMQIFTLDGEEPIEFTNCSLPTVNNNRATVLADYKPTKDYPTLYSALIETKIRWETIKRNEERDPRLKRFRYIVTED